MDETGFGKQWHGAAGRGGDAQMLKLSPQPQVPLMLGLLKMNSLASFDSTKSISVPSRVSWAFFSMNTLTPARRAEAEASLLRPFPCSAHAHDISVPTKARLTVLQHLLVRLPFLLGVVQGVGHSVTAASSHPDLQTDLQKSRKDVTVWCHSPSLSLLFGVTGLECHAQWLPQRRCH